MNKYETLMSEYPNIKIEEESMKLDGLYCDGYIWINKGLTTSQKTCILAEEIGHYETTAGDILDLTVTNNEKQEHIAKTWAYQKILPIDRVRQAMKQCKGVRHEMAEVLEVDEQFLAEALAYYGFV